MDTHCDWRTIPLALRQIPQWVNWQAPSKIPYDPRSGARAACNDPGTWAPFGRALAATRGTGLGLGFMVTAPWVAVDLDDCLTADGGISVQAMAILDLLDSYTEVTPSGTGLHIWCRGTVTDPRCRTGKLEVYHDARYLTMTGCHWGSSPRTIADRTAELAQLYREWFPALPSVAPRGTWVGTTGNLSDMDVLRAATRAKNGAAFGALFAGHLLHHPSHSEADSDLCTRLAWWCRKDAAQVDRLFRQSALYREQKWNEARPNGTYGSETVRKACAVCRGSFGERAA